MNNNQYNQYNQYQQNYNQYNQPNGNGGGFIDKIKDFLFNTPVEQEPIDMQDIKSNNVVSLIAYIGILFWVPLVAASRSKFARFHANQGLVLCLVTLVLSVVSEILYGILELIPVVGDILTILLSIAVYVAQIGWMAIGIYNCIKGRPNELPLIGKLRIIKTNGVSGGYNNNYNNYNNYNNNANNYNTQNNSYDANAYSNGTQNTGFDANAYGSGTQNTGFDANAYSSGTQNTGFDLNAYSSGTQNTDYNNNSNL